MTTKTRSPRELLDDVYATMRVIDADGHEREVSSQIPPAFSQALARMVEQERPQLVVEIGMACGLSSLAILSTLPEGAKLVSIDPYHDHFWRLGKTLVERSTRASAHVLVEKPDYFALPEILEQGASVDLAYIDGLHTFDYVALDAFYLDKALKVGGIMAFNDCGFRSIHKFLKYFTRHRHYEEIDVGLAPDYRGRNPLVTAVRWIEGRSSHDRYFRKLDTWEPEHNFFRTF